MNNKIVISVIFLSMFLLGNAQNDKKSIEVMTVYEQMAKDKNFKNVDILLKLANYNYLKAQYKDAERYYTRLFALTSDIDSQIYLRYAQCLRSNGKNAEADEIMEQYYAKSAKSKDVGKAALQGKLSREIKLNSGRFDMSAIPDHAESFEDNTFVFVEGKHFMSQKKIKASKKTKAKTEKEEEEDENESQLEEASFYAFLKEDYLKAKPASVKELDLGKINSKYDVSSPFLTKDGKTIYYTKETFVKKDKESEAMSILKLFKASVSKGKCKDEKELAFAKGEYNFANSVLSPDEKTLYFVSDMPGGFGDTDLYSVDILGNGEYSAPKNLGDKINTIGKETYPFVSDTGDLYFSSSEHASIGGLDVFVAKKEEDNVYKRVYNVGTPVNSLDDDYCYRIDERTGNGYFISNRNDDKIEIYKVKETKKLQTAILKNCVFINRDTKKPLSNVSVSIYDANDKMISQEVTNPQGVCELAFPFEENLYKIKAGLDGYTPIQRNLNTLLEDLPRTIAMVSNKKGGKKEVVKKEVYASEAPVAYSEKATKKVAPAKATVKRSVFKGKSFNKGDDLARVLILKNTGFGFNKSGVSFTMATDLKKVSQVMRTHSGVKIQIRTRADSRGKASYNYTLTQKRAKSIQTWLVKKGGVSQKRIALKPLGENHLLIRKCKGNAKCLEREHALNRKTDFIVLTK